MREALEVTIASEPKLAEPRWSALVALCRLAADRLDGPKPSGQIIAAYLSALKDLEKAIDRDEAKKDGPAGTLGKLRLAHGRQSTA